MTDTSTAAEIYIHLGLPKTASTFVQEELFPKLHGLWYLPKREYSLEAASRKSSSPILLTCEKDTELLDELDRIHGLIPHAKIILVFREPFSWLVSKYKYSIRTHGAMDFESYLQNVLYKQQGIRPGFYIDILTSLEEKFKGNYIVLNYDELRMSKDQFASRIISFVGASLNGALSDRIVKQAFNEKQLVSLLRFNRSYPYQESTSKSRMIRFLHYKYREFLLHIIAFLAGIFPGDPSDLEASIEVCRSEITSDWKKDWETVLQHIDPT